MAFRFLALLTVFFGLVTPASAGAGDELRGIWVTRWTYASASDVRRIMSEVSEAGFNAVFFQVRGQHDAFYPSAIEPWAAELTGALGKDPGWDPLAVAVEAGHAHGLQVHAYINAFTLWRGESPPAVVEPLHAWHRHPEWIAADSEGLPMALNAHYVFASPGNPEVRRRLAAVAKDIADRYPIDGIHLDYIRYPGRDQGHDLASLAAWEADGRPDFSAWRRQAVTRAVAEVRGAVSVPVTAAVWGLYKNPWGWTEVSEGFADYHQDANAFTAQGHVDGLIPMTYWTVAPGQRLDVEAIINDHMTRSNGRHVYAGVRADPAWSAEQVEAVIRAARRQGAHGVVLFEYREGRRLFEHLRQGVFAQPAKPPKMKWRYDGPE